MNKLPAWIEPRGSYESDAAFVSNRERRSLWRRVARALHASVRICLKRHKRFHMHFTPTSAYWLNQVERFFGLITEDRIRCGAFKSVTQLEAAIQEYLESHNADPKPPLERFRHHNPQKGGPWETSIRVGTLDSSPGPYDQGP
jgi:hypothetical protein